MVLLSFLDNLVSGPDLPWLRGKAERAQLDVRFGSDDGSGRTPGTLVEFRIPNDRSTQKGIVVASDDGRVYVARANTGAPGSVPFDFGKVLSLLGGYSVSSEIWSGSKKQFKSSGMSAKDENMDALERLIEANPTGPLLG